jgi:hypothetical protein
MDSERPDPRKWLESKLIHGGHWDGRYALADGNVATTTQLLTAFAAACYRHAAAVAESHQHDECKNMDACRDNIRLSLESLATTLERGEPKGE